MGFCIWVMPFWSRTLCVPPYLGLFLILSIWYLWIGCGIFLPLEWKYGWLCKCRNKFNLRFGKATFTFLTRYIEWVIAKKAHNYEEDRSSKIQPNQHSYRVYIFGKTTYLFIKLHVFSDSLFVDLTTFGRVWFYR